MFGNLTSQSIVDFFDLDQWGLGLRKSAKSLSLSSLHFYKYIKIHISTYSVVCQEVCLLWKNQVKH